ncbi:homeobox protein Hox-D11-like [Schistocerca piceifrons]|uniref:homeobox protein Hox-D11-like n=1 Tax=Schistocerca piceifrons TaxID=274613 RepID=UPI001F5E36CE|nr:homeobox protein Hox-D11-like [Schistocerca piceifrons]
MWRRVSFPGRQVATPEPGSQLEAAQLISRPPGGGGGGGGGGSARPRVSAEYGARPVACRYYTRNKVARAAILTRISRAARGRIFPPPPACRPQPPSAGGGRPAASQYFNCHRNESGTHTAYCEKWDVYVESPRPELPCAGQRSEVRGAACGVSASQPQPQQQPAECRRPCSPPTKAIDGISAHNDARPGDNGGARSAAEACDGPGLRI